MTDRPEATAAEVLAVYSARALQNGQVVFAGVGTPLLAASLAQRLDCPELTILFEGGIIGAWVEDGRLPPSTNDQRCTRLSRMVLGSSEVMLMMQRGYVDIGFLGGAQIDAYGNLNSSFIGETASPRVRLPGSGGANDIGSLTDYIVSMRHERRRFVPKVDFITTPGFLAGGTSRGDNGLPYGGCRLVVTDLGLFDFAPETRRMRARALHAGVTRDEVADNTGFDVHWPDEVPVTSPVTLRELEILRRLDPERIFIA
ncbi:CoA-transferase subunit beta [Acuticoccus sediminis]|uniref:CoA-transferase subunit beta n=1 Tax=Acuticoccus sediminis TaxID=2184697 RepID=UPI001B3BFA1D|nr:CoA-transferase [Acuticoccus sediminis]